MQEDQQGTTTMQHYEEEPSYVMGIMSAPMYMDNVTYNRTMHSNKVVSLTHWSDYIKLILFTFIALKKLVLQFHFNLYIFFSFTNCPSFYNSTGLFRF